MKSKLILFLFTLTFTACGHTQIERHQPLKASQNSTIYTLNYLGFGWVPLNRLGSEAFLCRSGKVEMVDLKMSGVDMLLTGLTAGIYARQTATVSCRRTSL